VVDYRSMTPDNLARMRILLDSRDLINVVEHGCPVAVADLDAYLRVGNHQIVLCFSNVREMCSPLSTGMAFLQLRPLLQSLEQLPHTYMKEATIVALELQAAVDAFNLGSEYESPSPFVTRWDRTLLEIPGKRSSTESLVNLRLDDIVFLMNLASPHVFAPPAQHLERLRKILEDDRALLRTGKAPAKQHFVRSVKNHAATHRIRLPEGREDEFALWVYANPNRCPGLRLNHEIFRGITSNYGDVPEASDFTDLALTYAVPYVDAATLDRRMRNYSLIASRKMVRFVAATKYSDRVYADVGDLMQRA
jgi:hypothetical protein